MNTDPISDLLTRIRNAYMAKKLHVEIPHSKVKEGVLEVLKKYEFIDEYSSEGEVPQKKINIVLRYDEKTGEPAITKVKRVSKPSLRKYNAAKDLKIVRGGYGIRIISTSQGIMSNVDAKKKKLGGEVMIEVY